MSQTTELDKAQVYLVPVARLELDDEPDHTHLAQFQWVERVQDWVTGLGICGRSTTQGALPEGTEVTCPNCLRWQPVYKQLLSGRNQQGHAERAVERQRSLAGDTVENGAWHTVWLEGKWRWVTSKMTTPQREYAADRAAAYSRYLAACDGELERQEPEGLRWWREAGR